MIDHLREAGVLVASLQRALLDGTRDLALVPDLIKRIIADEMWTERTDPRSGRKYGPFTSFPEFVSTPVDEGGLGSTPDQLYRLCPDLTDELDEAFGRKQRSDKIIDNGNNVTESSDLGRPEGNERRKALRRLRKDAPELHARVLAGELSANAAMIEAGFRPKTFTIRSGDTKSAARTLRKYYTTAEDRAELAKLLVVVDDG